jgi:catechol 2,3-dioxygenase-like lactoylglutathione lyase family enzyme
MKIVSLTLTAPDVRPLFEFYAGDLGMPLVKRSGDALTLRFGATALAFRCEPSAGFYHFALNVHPLRFERARAATAAVTPLLHDGDGQEVFDFRSWDARACYFYDPAGNIVELIARRALTARPIPPEPGFMSISEIGLVTDDVPALTARIGREMDLPVYRDSAGDTFAALGDEDGLLILSQRGRIWYPDTGKTAAPAALDFVLQTEDGSWRIQGPPYQFSRPAAAAGAQTGR